MSTDKRNMAQVIIKNIETKSATVIYVPYGDMRQYGVLNYLARSEDTNSEFEIIVSIAKKITDMSLGYDWLNYFNLIVLSSTYTLDPKIYDCIVEECFHSEEYADYICNEIENCEDKELAKFLADNILGPTIEALKRHQEKVTEAFYEFHKNKKEETANDI